MKNHTRHIALAGVALLAAACGPKIDQAFVEKKVAEAWRHCNIVAPEKVEIEWVKGSAARYSYALRMVANGGTPGYVCYVPNVKLLEALSNRDFQSLRKGEVVEVTKEDTFR